MPHVLMCYFLRGPEQVKRERRLEMDGKMLNVNEGRCVLCVCVCVCVCVCCAHWIWKNVTIKFQVCYARHEFHLTESEDESCFVLDIAIPRFMDTSLLDCDVQTTYIRVTIKGKVRMHTLPSWSARVLPL